MSVVPELPRIKELVDSQSFGKKTGKGFYEYSSNSYERINLTAEEAEKYNPIGLVATAANNAAWLISNSVCTKADLDKALSLGMGLKTDLSTTVKSFGHSTLNIPIPDKVNITKKIICDNSISTIGITMSSILEVISNK